ncbi:NAD(P)H-dependent oxidoreductase [Desulfurispirillum indicum]|uniref:NAD(P)H-dependent oxidoreductase n=1 Tax=Desulfurispirillum indicum TaxID=936456 RepID=UPI001CFC1B66|nr:NAD(P)H-dependent oxidoreductase [Desulfurispirillum indicum]UCZ56106.1 NAD(P)H-dependent oxidoreductase [Desulfurispirillum indicum]
MAKTMQREESSYLMKCLVVKAHPLPESLCSFLTQRAIHMLETAGHSVEVEDLYAQDFVASLTEAERHSYYAVHEYHVQQVAPQVERLLSAEAIVLVFPTWWFGFPAILKGWFDRVWVPGVAYDHEDQFGPIQPRLVNLRHMLAITSLGALRKGVALPVLPWPITWTVSLRLTMCWSRRWLPVRNW